MRPADLLVDGFGRVREAVDEAVGGLAPEHLTWRPDEEANPIGWLVWHLTRIQDDHIAGAFGSEQVWTAEGWADRFALPFDDSATGYGHSSADVVAVGVGQEALAGYHHSVSDRTVALLRDMTDEMLDRVVDESWDPPVTLAVRLVSVLSDCLQHAGQASYVRGLVERGGH